ncbi:hypothetical protein VB715_14580 [Crocosphaera sp. UHCC 0190]|nr:hypothetical protein [Crocosphaera sp. UHCC 0190]MEA5510997.1 hypothetical protein [Crocosphaera sp. UHCC 0190]
MNDLSIQTLESEEGKINQSDGDNDPLSKFIGAVFHGSLAKNIDQELYG